nr:hypothetical protein [Tanacetum cinerariifolium]
MLLVGGESENVPFYYHMYDNFHIQFGREEFCLVTGLKKDVKDLIESKSFKKLDNSDAVSLCCICILQLVLLGLEDRRAVLSWILRLANDRDGWDDYPWDDKKSYSICGFTWAFKTWILEVFRLWPNEYYTRHMRYPRIVAWTSNKKFYRPMLRDFLHGRVPAKRLIPDEVEAGSGWGFLAGPTLTKQRSGLDQMMKQGHNIFEQMKKYMEALNVDTRANREPIIADQHYGISDLSGCQSIQGRVPAKRLIPDEVEAGSGWGFLAGPTLTVVLLNENEDILT